MATAVLRFQCVDGKEASGKVALHASRSGEAGIGAGAGALEVEQLSRVCDERGWCGESERMESSLIKSAEGRISDRGWAHPFAKDAKG